MYSALYMVISTLILLARQQKGNMEHKKSVPLIASGSLFGTSEERPRGTG